MFKSISKQKLWEYFILVARYWMAFILIAYSIAKLTGHQFYISPQLLCEKVKDANLFQLSWFLADHQPFKYFIACSQLVVAALLIINKTALLGALATIPIWLNILVWDLSFMDGVMRMSFAFRLSFYIVLDCLVIRYYKGYLKTIISEFCNQKFYLIRKSVLLYISLPVTGFCLEFVVGKIVSYSGYLIHFLYLL